MNCLQEYRYMTDLITWLQRITGAFFSKSSKECMFEFYTLEEIGDTKEDIDMTTYMLFDDWWDQLQYLIKQLEERCKTNTINTFVNLRLPSVEN
jgi:hypothetical protein